MPRAPRSIVPGGVYHVSPRGNDGRDIFVDDADRAHFLGRVARVVRKYGWIVLGYCLMDNHFHAVVLVPEGNLSAGMQELLSGYARWWNDRHGHFGHLFRNHFDHRSVRSQRHLIATIRYIDLNAAKAGMVAHPEDWPYSSYRAHVGLEHPLSFLAQNEFLKLMGPTPDKARGAYRRFVREGRVPVSDTGFTR